MSPAENMKDILVIYEQEAEEWALYLKSLFGLIVNEEGILLYDLENSSFKHQELLGLPSYKCKLLILSCGLLNCLNQKRSYFLEQVLKPPDNVVILLCGVENSEILYEILTLDGGSKEISTDQKPEEYILVVKGIIQPDKSLDENPGDSVSYIYEAVLAEDHQTISDINLSDVRRASEETNLTFKTEILSERLESNEQSILVLPRRISCENPGEIFILLKDEIDEETLEIEFVADHQRIRTQTASWNKKVKYMKALDFPAGPVYVNVYCGGVIKTTAQIEYYTALEEIEPILKKVADPIAFTCQNYAASDFTNCKEEAEDSNTYEVMLGSETPPAMVLKAKQDSGDQHAIGLRCQQEVEVDEEKKDDLKPSREETEYEDEEEEDSYSFHNSPSSLYANIGAELKKSRRDCFFCKRPPPPSPQNLPGIQRQDNLHNLSQERNFMMDRSRREHSDGLTTACCREDPGTCEDSEEEHPYTCVAVDECVYDLILGQEEQEEEKRKHCRSFIMNRPPAPAPRPVCSPSREENTPYIVQVFQQKATRATSDNSRTYCEARNPAAHRGHTETVTYSTVVHNIPPEQKELIHLQEQVKKGEISVDEALGRFKEWQNKKQRLPFTQQEKVHHLRDTTIRNRQENENLNVRLLSQLHISFLCLASHACSRCALTASGSSPSCCNTTVGSLLHFQCLGISHLDQLWKISTTKEN
ncbi:B-cell scaffold protein with ankyrin repeats isoform X8 [Aphelocoma coerulescens]|uniref:B-cell scaffold protein with ankyrin repeats isoform X8 n=1 Tax=Aphelocoma coerulescens TaxID=39617 RepID=UPI003604D8EE